MAATQPSTHHGMIRLVSTFWLSNNNCGCGHWLPTGRLLALVGVGLIQESMNAWHRSTFINWAGWTLTMASHNHCPDWLCSLFVLV